MIPSLRTVYMQGKSHNSVVFNNSILYNSSVSNDSVIRLGQLRSQFEKLMYFQVFVLDNLNIKYQAIVTHYT